MKFHAYIYIAFILACLSGWAIVTQAAGIGGGTAPAQKAQQPTDLHLIDVGTVTQIIKSNLIEIDNEKTYLLDEIRVPFLHNHIALDYLQNELLGKKIGVFTHVEKKNRQSITDKFGRTRGHIVREDGKWIQADMTSSGIAWANSSSESHYFFQTLLDLEQSARSLKNGFWADEEYAVKTSKNISEHLNTYQIYGCLITNTSDNKPTYIFYCDVDKRNTPGLVFHLKRRVARLFYNDFFRHRLWINRRVLVRGWIEKSESGNNTPTIHITYPGQIFWKKSK